MERGPLTTALSVADLKSFGMSLSRPKDLDDFINLEHCLLISREYLKRTMYYIATSY